MSEVVVFKSPAGITAYGRPATSGQDYARDVGAVAYAFDDSTYQEVVSAVDINVTLPSAIAFPGREIWVRATSSGIISLLRSAVDGGGTLTTLFPGQEVRLVSTGLTGAGAGQGFVVMERVPSAGSNSVATMTGDVVLTAASPAIQLLDPGNPTRNLDMPAEATIPGRLYSVVNSGDGVEALVVRETGGAPTLATLLPGEKIDLYCDGATWVQVGDIVRKGVVTIAMTGDVALTANGGVYLTVTRDATGATHNLDLPPFATAKGQMMIIRVTGGAGGGDTVTVRQPGGAQLGANVILAGGSAVSTLIVVCDGVTWFTLGAFTPIANSI